MSKQTLVKVDLSICQVTEAKSNLSFDGPALAVKQTRFTDSPIYASIPPYLLLVVLKPGLSLSDIYQDAIIDVSLGWHPARNEKWQNKYHLDSVLKQNRGRRHSKMTVWSIESPVKYDVLLSEILAKSPKIEPERGTRRSIYLSPERLEKWNNLGGNKWLYNHLDSLIGKEGK